MSRLPYTYLLFLLPLLLISFNSSAQVDYKLWLQYAKVSDSKLASEYNSNINGIIALGNSETIQAASKELQLGLSGLLGNTIAIQQNIEAENGLIFGSKTSLNEAISKNLNNEFEQINNEGYIIKTIQTKKQKPYSYYRKNRCWCFIWRFQFFEITSNQ